MPSISLVIGRAGASPPSRTAAIIFLYIYLYIYLFIYIRPTVLAPGWPRATRKRSRPDHTCKYIIRIYTCIHMYTYVYTWSKLAYCESNNASHGNDKRGYRNAKRGFINQPTMIEHINHVETPGIFGTHMEILAMATYYGVPVFYCCLQGHSQQPYRWHFVRPISSKNNHLRYPELAGSPLEHVEPPTHFELSYMHNTHYNSIVSLTGELRNDLPELNHEEVHVVEVL